VTLAFRRLLLPRYRKNCLGGHGLSGTVRNGANEMSVIVVRARSHFFVARAVVGSGKSFTVRNQRYLLVYGRSCDLNHSKTNRIGAPLALQHDRIHPHNNEAFCGVRTSCDFGFPEEKDRRNEMV